MHDVERLREIIGQLVDGWNERIEYKVRLGGITEKRVERRWQPSLISQLESAKYHVPCKGSDGSGGGGASNKPASKTPGNLEQPDELLCRLLTIAVDHALALGILAISGDFRLRRLPAILRLLADYDWTDDDDPGDLAHLLSRPVRQARLLLGYDSRSVMFGDMVCESCGGALMVATDRPSAVRCAGTPAAPPCGQSYPWWTWGELAATSVMADTQTAVTWIGRPREVLYRWAREGRVTRHGSSRRGEARWDLSELPQAIPGQPLPDPPKKKFGAGIDKADIA